MYTFCKQKLLYVSFLKFVFQKFMSQIISAFSGIFFAANNFRDSHC